MARQARTVPSPPEGPETLETHLRREKERQAFDEFNALIDSLPVEKDLCPYCSNSSKECVQYNPEGCPDHP